MRVAARIELDAGTEHELRQLSRRRRVEARVQQRARVILLAAEGWRNKDIAEKVALDRRQVALWRHRFLEGGIDALRKDAPRPGRAPVVTPELESRILHLTLDPGPGAPARWSTRTLARHLQVSATTIRRVWQRNGVKPLVTRSLGPRRDPGYEGKRLELLGLYVDPPGLALVLGCDDHAPLQAPAPGRPGPSTDAGHAEAGHPEAGPRDDEPRGTRPLSAALDALAGTVISRCEARPRREAAWQFLRLVDRKAPRRLTLHLLMHDHEVHEHPDVQAWLARHPRIVLHATPSRATWRDLVERVVGDRATSGIGHDGPEPWIELQQAIDRYLADGDARRRPFLWSAGARR